MGRNRVYNGSGIVAVVYHRAWTRIHIFFAEGPMKSWHPQRRNQQSAALARQQEPPAKAWYRLRIVYKDGKVSEQRVQIEGNVEQFRTAIFKWLSGVSKVMLFKENV
jgi:hypothetical protein